ncbi:zinc finger protein 300-like isoform X2 [Osmerus eperlanus]|uniref:zinc finger protein 300-like isoform X2 n=1 Tax=Osmerus eperlanus TaxID=29151 RepID=UPI002E12152E
MSQLNVFRNFINERLTTAALEIFAAAEKLFAEFEEEICRSKEKSTRLQRLLDIVTQPEIKLHRTDVQQLSLPEPQQIKEEQELWTSQEEEQLQGLQSETTHSMFTSTSVKHDWDQEGFSECSHLDQTVKVENREGDSLPTNTIVEQTKAEPDGQDYAAPEPGSDSLQPLSVVAAVCPRVPSLEEEEHEGDLLLLNRTQASEALPRQHDTTEEQIKAEPDGQEYAAPERGSDSQPLSVVVPDCPIAQSLEVEHGGVLLLLNRTQASEALPREHMPQRRHAGKTKQQCQECNKTFSGKGALVFHMRKHTEDKSYHCKQCNKPFAKKGNLVKHMKTHSGERPFQCQECSKLFVRRDTLREHMRTHTSEKPYKCQHCNKSFCLPYGLVIHMRGHTGKKPFQCQQCNKRFSRKGNLAIHMRTHRRETLSMSTM